MVTVAPTSAAPVLSVTVPWIVPRNVCDQPGAAASSINKSAHTIATTAPVRLEIFMVFSCASLYGGLGRLVLSIMRMSAINPADSPPAPRIHPSKLLLQL